MTLASAVSLIPFGSGEIDGSQVDPLCSVSQDAPWTFSARPYTGSGYESRPVVVSAVKTTVNSLSVTEVRLRNISSKPVTSVRLSYVLNNEKDGKSEMIHTGESQIVPLEKTLLVGDTVLLKFPVFSFGEFKESLAAKQALKGDFNVQIFVKDIVFEDQTRWSVGDKVEVKKNGFDEAMIKVAFAKPTKMVTVMPLSKSVVCPKQYCKYVAETPPGYTCASSTNDEYCTNCITSCCNTICTDPSPSCGGCS